MNSRIRRLDTFLVVLTLTLTFTSSVSLSTSPLRVVLMSSIVIATFRHSRREFRLASFSFLFFLEMGCFCIRTQPLQPLMNYKTKSYTTSVVDYELLAAAESFCLWL